MLWKNWSLNLSLLAAIISGIVVLSGCSSGGSSGGGGDTGSASARSLSAAVLNQFKPLGVQMKALDALISDSKSEGKDKGSHDHNGGKIV